MLLHSRAAGTFRFSTSLSQKRVPKISANLKDVSVTSDASASSQTLYLDPICRQMDQRLLKCDSPDEVLTALTTHRGVMFVHNLVTAVTALARMSVEAMPFSRAQKFQYPGQLERIDRDRLLGDPRYVVLVRDLRDNASKLDLESIEKIMSAMRNLDHCHFKLFGALLKRVYAVDLSNADISTAVSIGQDFEWAGFSKAETFYNRLSALVEKQADTLSKRNCLNALIMFSRLGKIYPSVMKNLVTSLELHVHDMSIRELGIVSIAASEYGSSVGGVASLLDRVSDELLRRSEDFGSHQLRDWIRVGISLRRVNVDKRSFLESLWTRSLDEVKLCSNQRERLEPSVSSVSDLGLMRDACAHFGVGSAKELRESILPYLLDHLDIVTEETAIRVLFALSMFPAAVTPVTAPTVSLLIRKVGSATDSWERHKLKIFFVWISKCMQFDFVDSEFRKLIIDSSLAHFLMARRGYGVPYAEDSWGLFEAVKEEVGTTQVFFNECIPNSPFHADILLPELRVAVLVLSRFASEGGAAVGTDLLQIRNIESLGWKTIAVDRRILRSDFSLAVNQTKSLIAHS